MCRHSPIDYNVLRQQLLAKRKTLSISQRKADSQKICVQLWAYISTHFTPDELIAAFWPIGLEVDIKPLLFQLDTAGFRIALPRIIEKDAPLRFFLWHRNAPMTAGHFNIPEPAVTQEAQDIPALILTPLLGFTLQGDRLGYGKGYYDRTLSKWIAQGKDPFTVGISWNEGRIDDTLYHAAPHDIPLKRILTPAGWIA